MDSDSNASATPETPMTPVRPSFTLHHVAAMRPARLVPDPGLGQVTRMMEQIHQLTGVTRASLDVQRISNTSVTLAMAEQSRAIAQSMRVPTAIDLTAQLRDLGITRIAKDIPQIIEAQKQWAQEINRSITAAVHAAIPNFDWDQIQRLLEPDRRAVSVSKRAAEHGWPLDALLLLADDRVIRALDAQLGQAEPSAYSEIFLSLLITHEPQLRAGIRQALHDLLPTDRANDHFYAFEDALDSLTTGRHIRLVSPTMLSHAEGVFTSALRQQGIFPPDAPSMLYTNHKKRSSERAAALTTLKQRLARTPARGRRTLLLVSSEGRLTRQRDLLAETAKLSAADSTPPLSRHHTLHDGFGSGTPAEALRSTLFFMNVTLYLHACLSQPTVDEAVP
ncbi:hypothetical protein [Deinococcus sp. PEB2-67]